MPKKLETLELVEQLIALPQHKEREYPSTKEKAVRQQLVKRVSKDYPLRDYRTWVRDNKIVVYRSK